MTGLAIGLTSSGPKTPEDQFLYLAAHYDRHKGTAECTPIADLDPEIKDASVIEQFSWQADGNVVVLVSRFKSKSVEVWSSKLMADVFVNSKSQKKKLNGG